MENCSVANEFKSSLLRVKCLDDFIADGVAPTLGFFLIVSFILERFLHNSIDNLLKFIFDVVELEFS